MNIKKAAYIFAAGILLWIGIDKFASADSKIREGIKYGTRIPEYVFLIPGKKDKYLDESLKHFSNQYNNSSDEERYYNALRIIRFARDVKPDRLEDVTYSLSKKFMSNGSFSDPALLSGYTDNQAIVDSIVGQAIDSLIAKNRGEEAFGIASDHSDREALYNKIKEKTGFPPDPEPLTDEQKKMLERFYEILIGEETILPYKST